MARVLIVEDDKAIAAIERDYLVASSYAVDIAYDGQEGLDKALSGFYDLILLDVMLPKIDGFEVCRRLRNHLDIPIVMITARREDIDHILGLTVGADDYLVKPFSPSVLVAHVKARLAQYERLSDSSEEVDEHRGEMRKESLRLEPWSHRVFVHDKEVNLTNKEYELLFLLMSNPGVVFTRDQLYERIWGAEAYGNSTTIAVHINRLREKLGDDSSNPRYIETLRGVGYRFRA